MFKKYRSNVMDTIYSEQEVCGLLWYKWKQGSITIPLRWKPNKIIKNTKILTRKYICIIRKNKFNLIFSISLQIVTSYSITLHAIIFVARC